MPVFPSFPSAGADGNTFARVIKKVDETINNDDEQQNDDELKVALLANKIYGFYLWLEVSSPAPASFRYNWIQPAGASGRKSSNTFHTTAFQALANLNSGLSGATNGGNQYVVNVGHIKMGGTPADLQLTWAQNIATVGDTKVLAGSYLVVWEELP